MKARHLATIAVATGSVRAARYAARIAYNARAVRVPSDAPPAAAERVSVLMPARNEAHRISPGVRTLLAQRDVPDLEIIILDDSSTDGTADVIREAAAGDARVRVIPGKPLPDGWRGKPHACAQLGDAATGSVLAFVDADVTFAPHAMAAAVDLMRAAKLDFISPFPRQLTGSLAERLMQPLTAWVRLGAVMVRVAEDSQEPGALLANGQFLVIDAEAYRRAGGHAAIKDAVIDDVWLAATLKATGSRGVAVEGSRIASCRMYTGWAELRDGYTRWLWVLFPTKRGLAKTIGKVVLTDIVPPLAALRGSRIGMAGYLAGVCGRVVAARSAGDRAWPDALSGPVTAALSIGLYLDSYHRRHRRGSVSWKGRAIS